MEPWTRADRPRPVRRAVLGCRVAGTLAAAFGRWDTIGLYWTESSQAVAPTWAAAAVLGVAYWLLAYSVARGRRWAVVVAIVLTGLAIAYLLLGVANDVLFVTTLLGGTVPSALAVPLAARAAAVGGLVWLLWQLGRSIGAIRRAGGGGVRGFAVLPADDRRPGRIGPDANP